MKERLNKLYTTMTNSISFYPSLIALMYLILGFLYLFSPFSSLVKWFADEFPLVTFADLSTARAILTTLIGSIISLMVLSFSMVMVVLGQAINNYSPKILLALTSEKFHQLVLGHYLGTILFSLLMLLNFKSTDEFVVAAVGVFIAVIMAVWCLILFIYFIHYTSKSLQSNVITRGIYLSTKKKLDQLNEKLANSENEPVNLPNGQPTYVGAWKSGYLQSWEISNLTSMAENEDWVLYIHATRGDYIVEGVPFIQVWGVTPEQRENIKSKFTSHFIFADGEDIDFSYHYGMTQLMEIAIKALSPALNDPGTARLCLHYLTDLFKIQLKYHNYGKAYDDDENLRLAWDVHDFTSLFNKCYMPIMYYGKEDTSIQLGLIKSVEALSLFDQNEEYDQLFTSYLSTFKENVKKLIRNDAQRAFVEERLPRAVAFTEDEGN